MEDSETPRMHKYVANKTTRIMMATVRHVTAWAGRTKFQTDGFLHNNNTQCAALSVQRQITNVF